MIRTRMLATALVLAAAATLALPAVASAAAPLPFSDANAAAHIRVLCSRGPRVEGSRAEHKAFDYIADQLRGYGYAVTVQNVKLPKGKSTHNVIVTKPGGADKVIVLGAHVDTKYPAPGANDNGSGVATLLELARDLRKADTEATVKFAFFGAEEMSDSNGNHHHYGSRAYVKSLSAAQRKAVAGMVSVDMVGYGKTFNVRSMKVAPQTVVKSLQAEGASIGQALPFLKDPGRYGWSDHEAFERAGIPAAWLEWRNDTACHTKRDTPGRIQASRLSASGKLVQTWLSSMSAAQLTALRP
jgi:Zn-dependent M28 family amino/carboxypeptidase